MLEWVWERKIKYLLGGIGVNLAPMDLTIIQIEVTLFKGM